MGALNMHVVTSGDSQKPLSRCASTQNVLYRSCLGPSSIAGRWAIHICEVISFLTTGFTYNVHVQRSSKASLYCTMHAYSVCTIYSRLCLIKLKHMFWMSGNARSIDALCLSSMWQHTTGHSGFAECSRHSAKPEIHSETKDTRQKN